MKIPIRDDDILALEGTSEFDFDALRAAIEPFGFELYFGSRFALIQSELKHLVAQKGVSYIWQVVRQQEAILPRTENISGIVTLLAKMLEQLAPTQEFVIVDRYLLPKSGTSDYLDTLVSLLTPIVKNVRCLILVTGTNYAPQLLADLNLLFEADCKIVHRTSKAFHDRFWIADRQRGLFVGTSLNGIGRRYALADYMQENDIHEVVKALVAEDILQDTLKSKH